MRLNCPRFTIRWLMIVVAIVGVSLAGTIIGVRLKRRAEYFRQRAADLAAREKFSLQMLEIEQQNLTFYARMLESNASTVPLSKHMSPGLEKMIRERASQLQLVHDDLARSVEFYRNVACVSGE